MTFDNYETETVHIGGYKTCVYCGNTNLVIDDSFDDVGAYLGTRNYCTCEQAKIEQQMKKEITVVEDKIKEIENKYENKLQYNKKAIDQAKLEEILSNALREYIMYGELYGMNKEEFLNLAANVFDREVWDYDYEEDDE